MKINAKNIRAYKKDVCKLLSAITQGGRHDIEFSHPKDFPYTWVTIRGTLQGSIFDALRKRGYHGNCEHKIIAYIDEWQDLFDTITIKDRYDE